MYIHLKNTFLILFKLQYFPDDNKTISFQTEDFVVIYQIFDLKFIFIKK